MFSIFKRKGKTRKQQRNNDFTHAKGAVLKGTKLSKRDKQMIAVGRTHIHRDNTNDFKYHDEKRKKEQEQHRKEKDKSWYNHLKENLSSLEKTGRDCNDNKYSAEEAKDAIKMYKANIQNMEKSKPWVKPIASKKSVYDPSQKNEFNNRSDYKKPKAPISKKKLENPDPTDRAGRQFDTHERKCEITGKYMVY